MSDEQPMEHGSTPDLLCPSEASARDEAARRQATETEGAEWIYLRRDRDKQWVVRRWTGDEGPAPRDPASKVVKEFFGEFLNPFNYLP
jgi:hypothetical protein